MSCLAILPLLQASAETMPLRSSIVRPFAVARIQASAIPRPAPRPQMAFYRKYTEAMLRRYVRMSLEVGRVPSLLGREFFRARVTSYRMESFEDVVIFCHDVERCLRRLSTTEQFVMDRIGLKRYTVAETAAMVNTDPRTIVRRYTRALDRLTAIFLETRLLTPQKCCQAPKTVENSPTISNQDGYKTHFDGM